MVVSYSNVNFAQTFQLLLSHENEFYGVNTSIQTIAKISLKIAQRCGSGIIYKLSYLLNVFRKSQGIRVSGPKTITNHGISGPVVWSKEE